jgi:hypothetical protein
MTSPLHRQHVHHKEKAMILDSQNMFTAISGGVSVGDSPTSSGATPSTNIIDLGVNRDIGGAVTEHLQLLCQVISGFATASGGTLQVQLQTAPDNGSGAPGAWATIEQSDFVPVSSLAAGYKFLEGPMVSPVSGAAGRFLRLNFNVGTGPMTAGTLEAALVPAMQHSPTYKGGYVA